jgi:adenine/guanine phosphoribosyltransferase-like PRPP-binding protein
MSHAVWLQPLVDKEQLKIHAEILAEQINCDREKFHIDAIVVTGISGASIGGIISYLTNLPLIIVRKETDQSHSDHNIECNNSIDDKPLEYIVVDDLICSGETTLRIIDKMRHEINTNCELVKIYLYRDQKLSTKESVCLRNKDIPVFAWYARDLD